MYFELFPNEHYAVYDERIKKEGIYVLYDKNEIVYVGKSKNIHSRVALHMKDKVKSITFRQNGNIDLYELYLIKKYKPRYNKDGMEYTDCIKLPEIKGLEVRE